MEKYREVNTTYIYMSNHNHPHCKSFFDWGDNGGVSGEDITVINTSPQMHVNIRGIENNEITSVPIDTIGALNHSQAGPVIIIIHQC